MHTRTFCWVQPERKHSYYVGQRRVFGRCWKKERLRIMNLSKRLIAEESGQDVAEYALLLVLVVIAIAVAAPTFTDAIMSVFSKTRSVLGI